jgi:hypothetical protein
MPLTACTAGEQQVPPQEVLDQLAYTFFEVKEQYPPCIA